jgi:hypothetical protein
LLPLFIGPALPPWGRSGTLLRFRGYSVYLGLGQSHTSPPSSAEKLLPSVGVVLVWVAGPSLEGGQVAVLRLHAATTGHVTKAPYSFLRGVYVRQGTKHVRARRKRPNFGEPRNGEVRRIYIPRTPVNRGKNKGRGLCYAPVLRKNKVALWCCAFSGGSLVYLEEPHLLL